MKLIDITGQRFGRLVVLRQGPRRPANSGGSNWICLCDCGSEFTAIGSNIRKGDTSSCGCLAREWASSLGSNPEFIEMRRDAALKHGAKRRGATTPEYKVWLGMKARCYRPRNKDYPNWGGRGIGVCDRWLHSFESFLVDMGPRGAGMTIDRLDSGADYSPENCRWVNAQTQGAENRRGLRAVTAGGLSFPSIKAACAHFNTGYSTAVMRIRAGVDPEIAVTEGSRMAPRRSKSSHLPKGHPDRQP